MSTTPAVLLEAKFVETADTVQYLSDNCLTAIDKLTAINVTAANALLTLYLLAPAGVPSAANTVTITKTLVPGVPYLCPEIVGHILANGGALWAKAGSANAIAIRASGRKLT